jgi:uncharacterized protein (UPF0335 family)
MADVGGIASDRLISFIERLERTDSEIEAFKVDRREILAEAKGAGFDTKIINNVIKQRKVDASERAEQLELFDVYWRAVHGTGERAAA